MKRKEVSLNFLQRLSSSERIKLSIRLQGNVIEKVI
jgi:hypothetical protein